MGMKINIPIYVDTYLTPDGVGLYVSTEDGFNEKIFPFKDIMKDFLEMYLVPSTPPSMHDVDREKVSELINNIFSAIDYLRKIEHDTPTYSRKSDMGYRD